MAGPYSGTVHSWEYISVKFNVTGFTSLHCSLPHLPRCFIVNSHNDD